MNFFYAMRDYTRVQPELVRPCLVVGLGLTERVPDLVSGYTGLVTVAELSSSDVLVFNVKKYSLTACFIQIQL